MNTKLEAAARQALTVLKQCLDHHDADDAIAALREALAEQAAEQRPQNCGTGFCSCIECPYEQPATKQAAEPVAWANPNDLQNFDMKVRTNGGPLHTVPLYTHPAPAQQPLTDAMVTAAAREFCKIYAGECQVNEQDTWKLYGDQFKRDARAVLEAAHGITGSKT